MRFKIFVIFEKIIVRFVIFFLNRIIKKNSKIMIIKFKILNFEYFEGYVFILVGVVGGVLVVFGDVEGVVVFL